MKKVKKIAVKILKCFFALIGFLIFANGIGVFFVSNLNLGLFLTVFLGLAIMVCALLPRRILIKIPKWLKVFVVCGLCFAVTLSSFLVVYGSNDNAKYDEDAVVVLGCGIHGKTPSLALAKRLDSAVEYHKKNPDALIVVSGGQGPQEDITEAEAMEQYLLDRGVTPDKIIKEDKAVSTYTNFKYSKEILDEKLGDGYSITLITSEYHIFRGYLCAKEIGFDKVTHTHADTHSTYLIPGTTRECLAVLKFIVFRN